MRVRVPRAVYGLLILYIAISLGYQLSGDVSLIVGYFDLRHQVHDFPFSVDEAVVTGVTGNPPPAGISPGDTVETLNGEPYTGRAVWQAVRWYAHPDDTLRVGIRKPDGSRGTVGIPLRGYSDKINPGDVIYIVVMEIIIPLLCLLVGYWVVLARPLDLNAWFILVILSYPEAFIAVSTFNCWPGFWLVLRLYWHMILQTIAPAALLWFGLLFPERSRIDVRLPWFKWLVTGIVAVGGVVGLFTEYANWYDRSFVADRLAIDAVDTSVLNWLYLICIVVYWVVIFDKLRTASTPDARRRLHVLFIGSSLGLGNPLIVWGILPRFGVDPAQVQWLGYCSAIFLVMFPLSLAYVVVVQRALDVKILLRMGTRYVLAKTTVFLIQFGLILLLVFRVALPLVRRHNDSGLLIVSAAMVFGIVIRLNFVKRSPGDRVREWLDRQFFREVYNTEHVLSELAVQARSISDPAALIQTISARISEVLHVPQMAVMLRSGDVFRLQAAGPGGIEGSIFLAEKSLPVQHLVRTSAPAVLYRYQPEVWFEEAGGHEKRALNELNAEVLLPLAGRNRLMGVMVLGPKLSEEPYSPGDLRLLASIGVQAGLGLEVNELAHSLADEAAKHQRVQREVEIAREVQQRLFPEIPIVAGLELTGHCRPALGVGGDYYDFIPLEDGRLAIAIGDVSGKGIAAALLMASLRASLRGIVDAGAHDLARIVRKLNRLVHEASTANRYATFFFAIYDPVERRLHYVNAGHNAPMVLRHGRAEAIRLEACGPVVGLLKDVEYEEACLEMAPGDLFIGYTDGISEAMTVDDEEWGEERLQATALSVFDLPVGEILERLFLGAEDFAAGAPQYDDMTLLILRVSGK